MTLLYEDIYSLFLLLVSDCSFVKNDSEFTYKQMSEWLHLVCADPRVRAKFNAFGMEDEIMTITCQLGAPVDDQFDGEFVKNLLANGMVIQWLKPQVNNDTLTRQFIGGKEEKYFSQSGHLKEVKSLLSDTETNFKKLLRDYGYLNNSYLQEG